MEESQVYNLIEFLFKQATALTLPADFCFSLFYPVGQLKAREVTMEVQGRIRGSCERFCPDAEAKM